MALKRVLGRKSTRAERYKVERGQKLSVFKYIDLFRFKKPCSNKWRELSMTQVEAIRDKLQLVKGEWVKNLTDVVTKIYNCLPSEYGPSRKLHITENSEVENSPFPSSASTFPRPVNQINSEGGSFESMNDGIVDEAQISSSAEAITSHKRSACDPYPLAAKRRCLGQIMPRPLAAESEPQNNQRVQPSSHLINYDSTRPGMLEGANPQSIPTTEASLAPAVSNSIYPDSDHIDAVLIDEIIASAEPRDSQPAYSYDIDAPSIDEIIASAEPRDSQPAYGYDIDAVLIDEIIASAEPRDSQPAYGYDIDPPPNLAYQWSPPNIPNDISTQQPILAI
ncbi:hypothetical protein BDW59DRAFT_44346 [Aspergillus cavernicola]|uniref:MADS-box domain-containing protein n=1 Tax=Aspergillus cavernicola TaxID=176166 RepID=A0ABR4H9J2_9EURO